MLEPYRVIDLTNHRGLLCGQILADLGADVIQVEPPGGSSGRRIGPFAGDVVDAERSLFWWAYARNKRGVTLDLSRDAGRELFRRLVAGADFVIESERPGTLAAWGLDHTALAEVNPRIITVSISPFGQAGPKADWAESDLVLLAAGGPLVLQGDEDRAPVRLPVPQAYLHAAAEAAVAALVAHHEHARSGLGQHVDVSAQQAVALATQSYILCDALGAPEVRRTAGGLKHGRLSLRLLFPAADGFVAITFLFGSAIGAFSRRLMHWIHEEGGCDRATRDKDWIAYTTLLVSGEEPIAEFERVKRLVADFTRARTKAELLAAAVERDLLIAPVATIDEVAASTQLAARDYWRALPARELGRDVRYPGAFARFGRTPLRAGRPAPRLGEHDREVYQGELGLDDAALARLAAEGCIR
jgi:crotonobetainyl-CoA:carnitine CoA-transferase CaiB-like acyl-CoA transferase